MDGLVAPINHGLQNVDQPLAPRVEPGSPATPQRQELTPKEQVVLERVNRKANTIRTLAFPAAMAVAVPVAKDISAAAFKVYQDRLLREAGNPTDPVEIMLLEQLSLAHLRVAQLHAQAELAKSIEEMKICSTAATRLTGEVRRLALALKQYREPSSKRQFTVVRQQNVSTAGQQVAFQGPWRAKQGQRAAMEAKGTGKWQDRQGSPGSRCKASKTVLASDTGPWRSCSVMWVAAWAATPGH